MHVLLIVKIEIRPHECLGRSRIGAPTASWGPPIPPAPAPPPYITFCGRRAIAASFSNVDVARAEAWARAGGLSSSVPENEYGVVTVRVLSNIEPEKYKTSYKSG